MKVKITSPIQVGGHWYKIIRDGKIDDFGHLGDINYRTQTITIDPNKPTSQQEESLIHELHHLVNQVYCNGRLEESDVDPLSEGIYQALKQLGIEFDWSDIETEEI